MFLAPIIIFLFSSTISAIFCNIQCYFLQHSVFCPIGATEPWALSHSGSVIVTVIVYVGLYLIPCISILGLDVSVTYTTGNSFVVQIGEVSYEVEGELSQVENKVILNSDINGVKSSASVVVLDGSVHVFSEVSILIEQWQRWYVSKICILRVQSIKYITLHYKSPLLVVDISAHIFRR